MHPDTRNDRIIDKDTMRMLIAIPCVIGVFIIPLLSICFLFVWFGKIVFGE